jgi:hypothetical protein
VSKTGIRNVPEWRVSVCDAIDVVAVDAATRAIALLARWATRRVQRIAKERSGPAAAGRNRPRHKGLQPQEGEERA